MIILRMAIMMVILVRTSISKFKQRLAIIMHQAIYQTHQIQVVLIQVQPIVLVMITQMARYIHQEVHLMVLYVY